MAPVYKLKYFGFMGTVEPIRYLLAYGSIKYENVEINKDVDWVQVQKTIPFGMLPVFEVDQRVITQSVAISRYVGKLVGLVPTDDLEAAELDSVAWALYDYWQKVYHWYQEKDNDKKQFLEQELVDKWCPRYLEDFEKIVQKKKSYFGGIKLSWVDFYFVGIIESIQGMWGSKILEKQYPLLHQIFIHIHEIPVINTYISSRPYYKY